MIESVQKCFNKKICFCCNISCTSYSHPLNMLNIMLESRRVEFDLMFMYKIIHGQVDLNFSNFSEFTIVNTICVDMVLQLSH